MKTYIIGAIIIGLTSVLINIETQNKTPLAEQTLVLEGNIKVVFHKLLKPTNLILLFPGYNEIMQDNNLSLEAGQKFHLTAFYPIVGKLYIQLFLLAE